MDAERQAALWFLLRRLVPAAAALAIGIGVLLGAGASVGLLLLGFLFFLVAAIFLAGPLAQLLAEPVGELLWPKRYYDKPQPLYRIPQAKRRKGLPEEAIAEYEKIAAAHPDELLPWFEMLDIALTDLRDPARAQIIFDRGIAALANPKDRALLDHVYAATRERQTPPPVRRIAAPPRP